jgi:hypothetical protein
MLVLAWVRVNVCCPVEAEVKLVAVFWIATPVSSLGSELELTVKYTVPPARLIAVEPSESRKVRLIVLVSPLTTLSIVFPSLAMV